MAGEQLPGMNILNVLAQAPMEFMSLATRQMTEVMTVMQSGVTRLSAEMASPPALPAGLPAMPAGLPQLPGLTPQGAGEIVPKSIGVSGPITYEVSKPDIIV